MSRRLSFSRLVPDVPPDLSAVLTVPGDATAYLQLVK